MANKVVVGSHVRVWRFNKEKAIESQRREFTLADLERACPGVSRDLIRKVLRRLWEAGRVEALGRGPGASWRKKG